MIGQILKRQVASDSLVRQALQVVVGLLAAIICVAGFRKLAQLDLTEAQLFLSLSIILSLVLQCFILWALLDLRGKAP